MEKYTIVGADEIIKQSKRNIASDPIPVIQSTILITSRFEINNMPAIQIEHAA